MVAKLDVPSVLSDELRRPKVGRCLRRRGFGVRYSAGNDGRSAWHRNSVPKSGRVARAELVHREPAVDRTERATGRGLSGEPLPSGRGQQVTPIAPKYGRAAVRLRKPGRGSLWMSSIPEGLTSNTRPGILWLLRLNDG